MNTPHEFEKITPQMVLKFLWRHILTIPAVSLFAMSIIGGNDNFIMGILGCTLMAMAFDHVKCNRASWGNAREHSPFDDFKQKSPKYESWNRHEAGTIAYTIERGKLH